MPPLVQSRLTVLEQPDMFWGSQPNHLINGANSKEPQSQNNLAQSSPLPLAVLNINVPALSHKFFPIPFCTAKLDKLYHFPFPVSGQDLVFAKNGEKWQIVNVSISLVQQVLGKLYNKFNRPMLK